MTTVRNQILREIKSRIESATLGGVQVGLARFTDQLEPIEAASIFSAAADTPKHVIEIAAGQDQGPGNAGEAASEAISIDRIAMIVLIVVHMAEKPDPAESGSSWTEMAGEIHNDLYELYTRFNGQPDQSAETWNGHALETRRLSGGNLFVSDLGARATEHVFEVVYRHTYGDGSTAR